MKCTVCGGPLLEVRTDLPFKVGDTSIVIIKNLPVFQGARCPEYLIVDAALKDVDEILEKAGIGTELEVVRYAA